MKSHLARLQSLSAYAAGGFAVLGFAASLGARLFPLGPPWLALLLHLPVALLGAAAAWAAARRGQEIDRWRWEMVDDPLITGGEREEAHKEAERQRRHAGTAFLAGPVFLGYWLLYQLQPGLVAWFLPGSALLGYAVGYLVANRKLGDERTF